MTTLSFKIDISKNNADFNDFKGISDYINNVAKELENIDDKVVFELTVKKLSRETGVDYDTILSLIKKNNDKEHIIITKPKQNNKNKYEKAEEYLIYYMLRSVDAILLYQNKVSYLENKVLSKIAIKILDFYEKNHYINLTDFTLFLEDDSISIKEVLKIDSYDLPGEISIDVIEDYIKTIDEGILKRQINKVKENINSETNVAKKIVLLEKLAELKKKEYK